jgi:hypothetical protein
VRHQLPTLLEEGFVKRAENLLVLGLPGRGKTHFLCALGRELILRRGCTVYFTPAFKLVQQAREEMEVLFTFLAECNARRSVLVRPEASTNSVNNISPARGKLARNSTAASWA